MPDAKKVICINTQQIYENTMEASKAASTSIGSMRACCQGRSFSSGADSNTGERLYWAYYEEGKDYSDKTIYKKMPTSIICIDTGEVFGHACNITAKYGYDASAILKCCCGKSNTSYGFRWEYYNENKNATYQQIKKQGILWIECPCKPLIFSLRLYQ